MRTVVAMYDRFEDAQSAVRALRDSGFDRDDINMIASDASGEYSRGLSTTDKDDTGSGAAAGAGIGAVLGGLGGLLLGLGALAIPGIGPVLAAGPIVAALAGAGVGAVAGGLIGALVDLGIPEEHAQYYAEGIRRGGTLVTVSAEDHRAEEARMLLNNFNPVDISTRAQHWREEGWTGYQQGAQMGDATTSDVSYNRQAAVPVTGADADQDLMDDDTVLDDPSMHRDVNTTGNIGVTGMPYDRDLDVMDRDSDLDRDSQRRDDSFRDQTYGTGSAFHGESDRGSLHVDDEEPIVGSTFRSEGSGIGMDDSSQDVAGSAYDRTDEQAHSELHDWNRDSEMGGTGSTFDADPNQMGSMESGRNMGTGAWDSEPDLGVTGGSFGAGSTYDRDVNNFGGSNIPVTGGHNVDDDEFNIDDDLSGVDDRTRDDILGTERSGMNTLSTPMFGGGEDLDDRDTSSPMVNDHLHDDVYGANRPGSGPNDIPVTGRGMMNADMGATMTGGDWDMYDTAFQDDYRTRYGMTSYGYDYYQPAYRFGYDLANDSRYHDYDWEAVEMDARRDWEMRGQQGVWDDVKDAVRHAWHTVTGR